MFELLKDLNEFLGEREREKTVKVTWQTHEQQMEELNYKNNLQFAKALNRLETETDPEVRRKIDILITAGIYDIDNNLDKI